MKKYFSFDQIKESIRRLEDFNAFFGVTFWAAKLGRLPVGATKKFHVDAENDAFLKKYYRLNPSSHWFFRVFRQNDRKKDWVRPDYAGKGLQAINTQSFQRAFIHPRNSHDWGWSPKYVSELAQRLPKNKKVPLFHVAVWLNRNQPFSENVTRADVVKKFISEFFITPKELQVLFDDSVSSQLNEEQAFSETPVQWSKIQEEYSAPEDAPAEGSGILSYLETGYIGPAKHIEFSPSERLNVITGDNGLGKTFLLEIGWWALTNEWAGRSALPHDRQGKTDAYIKFQIASKNFSRPITVKYKSKENIWPRQRKTSTVAGLVIYARVDGSFAIWDPTAFRKGGQDSSQQLSLVLPREQLWDGGDNIEGLIRDWTKWQDKPDKYPFEIFKKVLKRMSPPDIGDLVPGEPVRIPDDRREIPTLVHRYGTIPIVNESAGIRRILTMAYLIVWAWNEHKIQAEVAGTSPETRMVVIIDELEAHLHPKWQRTILPAILGIVEDLSNELAMQLIVATHSPLVLASCETVFDQSRDKLFHLDSKINGEVVFRGMPFSVQGNIESWLTSEVFQLKQARSLPAENAVSKALALQETETVSKDEIESLTKELAENLSENDDFWPRWVLFAAKHGVEL
ncbi:MAG: ATP-binding protein [Verrucomicrobiota bacterium]|jgi:hypothetical protein